MRFRLLPPGIPISKRILDILLTILLLIVLSPLLLVIAILEWITSGAPILFCQERPGYLGNKFVIYKFRSMTDIRGEHGRILHDEQRITSFGRFLRSTSIDELPELLNVLLGEMSLVGPRPLLTKYLERYNREQAKRHNVLPGITGWAQINGRNILSWEDKFRYDVWYVEHWSFLLDIKIILITIWKVIKREGIAQPGHVSAEEFKGEHIGEQGVGSKD